MARYVVSRRANQDINDILVYIAADNVDAALALYDRFIRLFEMLRDHREMGRERPELAQGLRSFPEGSYSIFYRVWAGDVTIVRVLHAARDEDEILD